MSLKVAQFTLWFLFLFLAGKRVQSHQTQAPSTAPPLALNIPWLSQGDESSRSAAPRLLPFASTSPAFYSPSSQSTHSTAHARKESWPQGQRFTLPSQPDLQALPPDLAAGQWSYRSTHFQLDSDTALPREVVQKLANCFELTHRYCHQLPLGLDRHSANGKSTLRVQLIADYLRYLQEGGPPGSGGMYLTQPDLVLLPFEGLGLVKCKQGYQLQSEQPNRTLIHEATHMMMRGPLLKEGWFVEGTAEYVATIPVEDNSFLLSHHLPAIKSYLTSYGYRNEGGHNLGNEILLTSFQKFIESDYRTFQEIPHSYPYSLLVFYYFAHLAEDGKATRLKAYAQALNQGATRQAARELLLAGQTYQQLQTAITQHWAKEGIHLTFSHNQLVRR